MFPDKGIVMLIFNIFSKVFVLDMLHTSVFVQRGCLTVVCLLRNWYRCVHIGQTLYFAGFCTEGMAGVYVPCWIQFVYIIITLFAS